MADVVLPMGSAGLAHLSVTLNDVNNKIGSINVDAINAVRDVTLTVTHSDTRAVLFSRTFAPGQVYSQSLLGPARLDRETKQVVRPSDSSTHTHWAAPDWSFS